MLYTTNIKAGSFDLEQKLSLLILPLIFFSDSGNNNIQSLKILKSFVIGCVLAGLICIANAALKYYISGEIDSLSLYTVFTNNAYLILCDVLFLLL
jgi:hypothetical protein